VDKLLSSACEKQEKKEFNKFLIITDHEAHACPNIETKNYELAKGPMI
jgi:hypothetical protein